MESFGDNLLMLIRERKMTPYRFAKEIGISNSSLRNWLKNRAELPRADTFIKICHFFMVEPEWLLGDGEHKKPALLDRMMAIAKKLQDYYAEAPVDAEKLIQFIEVWLGGSRVDLAVPKKRLDRPRRKQTGRGMQGL
jgi:putative transcriptional regulator